MSEHGFDTLKLPIEPGDWRDADERMFQACFAILGQFVEDELGEADAGEEGHRGYLLHSADIEADDISGLGPRPSSDRTAIDLWLWYRDELPEVERAYAAELDRCYGGGGVMITTPSDVPGLHKVTICPRGEMALPHDYPETIKDEKLRQLIDMRRSLWT